MENWKPHRLQVAWKKKKSEGPGERKRRRDAQGAAGEKGAREGGGGRGCTKMLGLGRTLRGKGVPGGKPKLWMGRTARTDVPEVIRYFEARKRKCQFANPGRKLRHSRTSSIRSPSPSLPRRSNFREYNTLVPSFRSPFLAVSPAAALYADEERRNHGVTLDDDREAKYLWTSWKRSREKSADLSDHRAVGTFW